MVELASNSVVLLLQIRELYPWLRLAFGKPLQLPLNFANSEAFTQSQLLLLLLKVKVKGGVLDLLTFLYQADFFGQLIVGIKGKVAALGACPAGQVDLADVAGVVVVVTAAEHAVLGAQLDGRGAADAYFPAQADNRHGLAVIAAPDGIDVAHLKLAPAAPLQAAVHHLLDHSASLTLLAPIRLFQEGRLNYLSLGTLSSPGASLLSHALRVVLLQSFEVAIFCFQERGGDAFLEGPFPLARPAGKLIFLLERLDEVAQVGTYGVAHLRLGMVLVAVGASDAALLVVAVSSLAMLAPLLEVAVAIHIH